MNKNQELIPIANDLIKFVFQEFIMYRVSFFKFMISVPWCCDAQCNFVITQSLCELFDLIY